jgi:RHS repeat-associated protein
MSVPAMLARTLPRLILLWLVVPLSMLALGAPSAAAQKGGGKYPPGQICTNSIDPNDHNPPYVSISPSTNSVTSTSVVVTIDWCEREGYLNTTSRSIKLNGVTVTSNFTYQASSQSGCTSHAVSVGTITIQPTGTNTLVASIKDNSVNTGTRTQTYTYTPPGPTIAVTPTSGAMTVAAGKLARAVFTLQNTSTYDGQVRLAATCSGSGVQSGSCEPAMDGVFVGRGQTVQVGVAFRASTTGGQPGTISLAATNAATGASFGTGAYAVTTSAPPLAIVEVPTFQAGTMQDRSQCLTFAIVPDVADQCGVLRLTHALPSVRTRNKVRTPTLVYYGDAVYAPTIAVNVTLPASTAIPDSVQLIVKRLNADGSVAWTFPPRGYPRSVWEANRARRLSTQGVNAIHNAINRYQVEVRLYTGASFSVVGPIVGEIAWASRFGDAMGSGWWLAGVERLFPGQWDQSILWVGGDGSTRKFDSVRVVTGGTLYTAPAPAGVDSLVVWTAGGATRYLTHGGRVEFDGLWRHSRTISRTNDTTTFTWVGSEARLQQITVPGGLHYDFGYEGTRLKTITAPPVGGQARVVRLERVVLATGDTGQGIARIIDPDNSVVQFEFESWGPEDYYHARTDRRGTRTEFWWEGWTRTMAQFSTNLGPAGTVTHRFRTDRGMGAVPNGSGGVAELLDSVYFRYDGPRTDVTDITKFWLDSLGAPMRIVNALGQETKIARGDPRFGGLATRVQSANGHVVSASYDNRGNLLASYDRDPYGDGRDAITRAHWDTVWNRADSTISAEGVVSTAAYDGTTGNLLWQQVGADAARRVTYSYYGSTGIDKNLPKVVQRPSAARDSIGYDGSLGNLSVTRSALGIEQYFESDAVGRPTVSRSQIERNSNSPWRHDSTTYDLMGRVIREVQYGPSVRAGTATAVGEQKVVVEHIRTLTGADSIVRRWSEPDPGNVGHIITEWRFDPLGRVIAEVAPDGAVDSTRYDPAGNVTRVRTRRGDTLSMSYDALNRLATRFVDSVRHAARDNQGIATINLQNKLYRPYPYWPTNLYDGSLTIPSDFESFAYDALGNLTRADNGDALIRRGYYPNGALRADTLIIKTYGLRDTSTMHRYVIGHQYDRDGRETVLKHPAQLAPRGAAGRDSVIYQYDTIGQLASVTDPLGNAFQFLYDAAGRRIRLSMPGGIRDSSVYDLDDELTRSVVFNGSLASTKWSSATLRDQYFGYDGAGRVLSMTNLAGMADTILSTYAPLGHLVQRQYWQPVVSNFGNLARIYNTERFSLDALGNRLSTVDSTNLWSSSQTSTLRTPQTLRYNQSGLAPTGRLRELSTPTRTDSTLYDASGNVEFTFTWQYPDPYAYPGVSLEDHANFYGADNRLRVAEYRTVPSSTGSEWPNWYDHYEEYRYDALGRRVLVRTRRMCADDNNNTPCKRSTMRRVVWDGEQELYEIQMPGRDEQANYWENDTAHVHVPNYNLPTIFNVNPQYGRVAYTHALGLDEPLAVTRINYVAAPAVANPTTFYDFVPFTVVPHWDWQTNADLGTVADGVNAAGGQAQCFPSPVICAAPTWQHRSYAFLQNDADTVGGWYGSLLTDRKDATGQLYRRNRYVDPATGRFTQEDPIGLAGGVNLYGFAGGDPVSYADPFGLCPWCVGAGVGALVGAGGTVLWNYAHDQPLMKNLVRNTLIGAAAGATLGLGYQFAAGAAAGGAAAAPAFENGSRIQQFVETSKGSFEFIAQVAVQGKNLTLNNISWFHVTEEGRVPLGVTEQRALISQLAQQAKNAGYDRLVLEGVKWGADKVRNFNIDLTQLK